MCRNISHNKYYRPHRKFDDCRADVVQHCDVHRSAPSHVTPAVVATASRLHAGLPARTATSTSNPRHAPHARAARKSLHPEHAGHHAHARPRVSPGLPAAAEEPLPAVDSTDEDEGDLALVLAHHNCKIGAPQGDDELVLALAQHNSRVRHREQSPEASKQGQQDDEDVAKALAEHNNRVRQRAASPQQQATLPPVDGQDTDEERALDQHQPPSPPSGKLHDRQAGNNTAAAAGACAGMLDEDELVAMLAAHNARVGIQRLARIAPAPASGRVEEETLPPPASAAPRSIRPLAHVTHTARSHKPVATAGGQLQSTLDAQLALKVNRHTTKTQQKQHRPPKHAIWRGSDAHESAARLEGKAAASRRPVLQDKSNRATATGNLKQREKAKQVWL